MVLLCPLLRCWCALQAREKEAAEAAAAKAAKAAKVASTSKGQQLQPPRPGPLPPRPFTPQADATLYPRGELMNSYDVRFVTTAHMRALETQVSQVQSK